ncbi:Oligoendopeptidase F, partial [hydrothermal vent metagenome]
MTAVARKRDEIPQQYQWHIESIFATPEAWETAVSQFQHQLKEIDQFKGRLHESPTILANYLTAADALATAIGKIYVYAALSYSVDTTNQTAAARNDQARGLYGMTAAATAFAQPEMLAIGFETLRKWLTEDERLANYGHYLDRLETQQAHVRSAEVEQVLGMARDTFGTASATHGILANADLKFETAV